MHRFATRTRVLKKKPLRILLLLGSLIFGFSHMQHSNLGDVAVSLTTVYYVVHTYTQ